MNRVKGKRAKGGGDKARPQAEWYGVNTCDTFHIISIKFHILITFILHVSIIQNVIIYFILSLTSSVISK